MLFQSKYNFPRFQRVQHFPGGVQLFQGGVQVVISLETRITFDFPGEGVWNPYPPSESAHDCL